MKKINIDEEENNLLKFEFAMPSVQSLPNVGFGLSSLEIERTRIFAIHNPMSNQYGTISDVNWLINYKSDGSGHWNLSFTQNVKWVLTRGSTTVSITDAANTVISTFDVVFFSHLWRKWRYVFKSDYTGCLRASVRTPARSRWLRAFLLKSGG